MFACALAVTGPLILMWVVDHVATSPSSLIVVLSTIFLFLSYQGRAALSSLAGYFTLAGTQRSVLTLRMEVLRHLNLLSADYHDVVPIGTRLYALQEPIEEIAYFASDFLPSIARALFTTIFAFLAMSAISPKLVLLVIPTVPAFLIARHYFRSLLQRRADQLQACRSEAGSFLQEHLTSVIQIQLLQQERQRQRVAFSILAKASRAQARLALAGIRFTICTNLPIGAASALTLGFGITMVSHGTLSTGGLVAIYSCALQLFDPLGAALEMYGRTQRVLSNIRQVHKVLSQKPSITELWPTVGPSRAPKQIHFRNVRFAYPGHAVHLLVPELSISSGEFVGIVGKNGAGKSTFAKLLPRLYDVTSGSITLDSYDIRYMALKQLRRLVCYVPAIPILFNGSLEQNLRFGNGDITHRQIQEVADLVGLAPLIELLPMRWKHPVGPGGNLLSGGQRQAVALARSILRRPEFLIIDEGTGALDPASELIFLRRLRSFLSGTTMLFVTHRFVNLSMMNRILVFDAGRIVKNETIIPPSEAVCSAM
jgi:ABC-type bacteriocin/lantibiotic exporter with double-glycine peptidase domain